MERGLFVEITGVKWAVIWTVTWELDLNRVFIYSVQNIEYSVSLVLCLFK
jgi:hypothetical protein